MKDQNIQKSEEDNIESSNSSDQYNTNNCGGQTVR